MKLYCNHNVECLGQDADEMQIRAICSVVDIDLSVYYVDLSGTSSDRPNVHNYRGSSSSSVSSENADSVRSSVCLLYRPGHYDLLI